MTQFYIETDGKIYLVESRGQLVFPRSTEQIPFEIKRKARMVIGSEEVIYAEPLLSRHPREWLNKEDVPLLDDVDPTVQKAVNFSLPRVVVEAVIKKDERVLLVKPSRGYNEDRWTLPGGFLVYSETPEDAVRREVEEEVGVEPSVNRLLNVYSARGAENSYQWLIFYFGAEIPGDYEALKPHHEIKQLGWFEPGEATEAINSPLMREGFEQIYRKENKPSS
jgi:ADP-ribose pyrophosphatase YjhB (NUDIX family)